MKINLLLFFVISILFSNCANDHKKKEKNIKSTKETGSLIATTNDDQASIQIEHVHSDNFPLKLSHNVNTAASEYYPSISPDGKTLFFTGMDRTGFFDIKLNFTKTKNNGGEDIFYSKNENGLWSEANIFKVLSTNYHEAVNQSFNNGDLLVTGNYIENMGPTNTSNGSATTDLFLAKKNNSFKLYHFEEPVNSIYSEADGFLNNDQTVLLFVSDRPGHIGNYHKKGWLWNDSYWGNTDIYVTLKNGDSWSVPKNLGNKINTQFTERTPWLSKDGLTLFMSSNGYKKDKKDLDIYFFKRENVRDWNNWKGPFEYENMNSNNDDWGYNQDEDGIAYFARGIKLDFVPTKRGRDGTGFVFENNFRSGYTVLGAQSGSFKSEEQTDIFFINNRNIALTLPDILFEVDSYKLKSGSQQIKNKLLDFISINVPNKIKINGYTDNSGSETHNQSLSLNRANSVKQLLIEAGVKEEIIECKGYGSQNPIASNTKSIEKAKNRRVEILIY